MTKSLSSEKASVTVVKLSVSNTPANTGSPMPPPMKPVKICWLPLSVVTVRSFGPAVPKSITSIAKALMAWLNVKVTAPLGAPLACISSVSVPSVGN